LLDECRRILARPCTGIDRIVTDRFNSNVDDAGEPVVGGIQSLEEKAEALFLIG
jgi:hypothetical protein